MNLQYIQWFPATSKHEALGNLSENKLVIMTNDQNSFGYFLAEHDRRIIVEYADIGIKPQAIFVKEMIFLGVNEILVGIDTEKLAVKFRYKMPLVFHEFLDYNFGILVRDEIGFVNVSKDGRELWSGITDGPINDFRRDGNEITGSTIDGDKFYFRITR